VGTCTWDELGAWATVTPPDEDEAAQCPHTQKRMATLGVELNGESLTVLSVTLAFSISLSFSFSFSFSFFLSLFFSIRIIIISS